MHFSAFVQASELRHGAAMRDKTKRKKSAPQVVNKSKKGFGKPSKDGSHEPGQPELDEEDEAMIFALDFIGLYVVRFCSLQNADHILCHLNPLGLDLPWAQLKKILVVLCQGEYSIKSFLDCSQTSRSSAHVHSLPPSLGRDSDSQSGCCRIFPDAYGPLLSF